MPNHTSNPWQPCTTPPGALIRSMPSFGSRSARAENRFGLEYTQAALALGKPVCPILDIHTHVNGAIAAPIYWNAAKHFGIEHTFTQVRLPDAPIVLEATKKAMAETGWKSGRGSTHDVPLSFIAFPEFRNADKRWAFTQGYLEHIQAFRDTYYARMIKLWNAPRMYELFEGPAGEDLIAFDSPWRVRHTELAQSLGMGIMVHIADPDSWFATRYSNAKKFHKKRDHYPALERMMDRFEGPWLAAHMGGYAEDLDFLDGLLTRHPNLSLDTSATKWIVRELSRHPRERVRDFFFKWEGRILFGSDIVTVDEHTTPKFEDPSKPASQKHPMADLADSPEAAFDLYSSRYFTLRLLFETDYEGPSPIADPDLRMVDPTLTDSLAAPFIRGLRLPPEYLRTLYRGAAESFLSKIKAK
ncbi:MAG: hypothetical protein U0640_06330 [Phycisphaerales bacterium]